MPIVAHQGSISLPRASTNMTDLSKKDYTNTYATSTRDSHGSYDSGITTVYWTEKEEKRVVRKIDIQLLLVFCIMYIALAIDKHNLSNALTDRFLEDLHMTTRDYNKGMTITLVGVLVAEFPVQILVVRYGFRNLFPGLVMAWGTVSWAQAFMTGRVSFYTTRFLIGALEGGFQPGVILLLSYFYKSREMTPRLAILNATIDLSHVFSGLIAAGVLQLRHITTRPGWFWLFIIEGVVVFLVGLLSHFYLPTDPTLTASPMHPKPWFTTREQAIAVQRLQQDDESKAQNSIHKRPTLSQVLNVWCDSSVWGFYLAGLIALVPRYPVKIYLHLTLRRLGFSTFESNLLSIPSAAMQIITVLGLAWSSEHFNERTWHIVFGEIFCIPMLVALEAMPPGGRMWGRYSCATLICGSPSFFPILASWISEASGSLQTRAITIATMSVLSLLSAIIGSQVYQKSDEPYYYNGNKVTISAAVLCCLVLIGQKQYLKRVNKTRGKRWQAMTDHERVAYQNNKDQREKDGNKRLDFRFPL